MPKRENAKTGFNLPRTDARIFSGRNGRYHFPQIIWRFSDDESRGFSVT
jgi:hypothetical protein